MKNILTIALMFCSIVASAGNATATGKPAKANEPSISDLLKLWSLINISEDDLKFASDTILPLYQYVMANHNVPKETDMVFAVDTITAAKADGCHFGIGNESNAYNPDGIDDCLCKEMGGKPKRNGAYPWGMVQAGKRIFWGTVNNILCMPSWQSMTSLSANEPYENDCWVCEYDKGTRKDAGESGDIERPRVYMYNTLSGFVNDITPNADVAPVLDDCLGLRSAAYMDGVVFLGGPGLDSDQGQTSTRSAFLAFSDDGQYLGCSDMSSVDGCKVTDVRRWVVHEGILYCGVAITDKNGIEKGAILRWYGNKDNPFSFHIVGYTANEAGELCVHNGRLYAGGWPTSNFQQSAIFEGPIIPQGGLTPDNAYEWEIKWKMDQYEPNMLCRRMEQCSLLTSYNGKLYWSMWFVQYGLLQTMKTLHLDITSPRGVAALLSLFRQATLWRTDDFTEVEMLYGEENLPNYNLMTGKVELPKPNAGGYKSVYGRAGFDRIFTAYMWSTAQYNNKLYIGTMSTEQLLEPAMSNTSDSATKAALYLLTTLFGVNEANKGYELYEFSDNNSPARTVTQDGFGNHTQYGIRNMVVSADNSELYLGTASPFNLKENGGWHLLRLQDESYVPTDVTDEIVKPGVLVRNEDGYVVLSSMLNERIKNITVTDLAGRVISSETPVNYEAYLFPQVIGTGVFIVTVTTESGSWTTKVAL